MPEKDIAAHSLGRYVLFREVAHGGMATVHLGRLRGPAGFARTVAIKRLHAQFARDPEFVSMFLDEARLAARIQHPNVVDVLDVVAAKGELFLVMDYVHGEALSKLLRAARSKGLSVPPRIVAAIATNVLDGLHAAHEARNERGDPLGIVHRDVSPQNVLVGLDGIARVLDFGIAKATTTLRADTRSGEMKGKLAYMSPEQIDCDPVDRRSDLYATAVMLWEALTGERLFAQAPLVAMATLILTQQHRPPSALNPHVPAALDAVVMRGLSRLREDRFDTAREMAVAIERAVPLATAREVGEWVHSIAAQALGARERSIAEIEGAALPSAAHPSDSNLRLGSAIAGVSLKKERESLTFITIADAMPAGGEPEPRADSETPSAVVSQHSLRWRGRGNVGWFVGGASAISAAIALWVVWAPARPTETIVLGGASAAQRGAPSSSLAALAPPSAEPNPTQASSPPVPVASPATVAAPRAPAAKSPVGAPAGVAKPRPAKSDCEPPYTIDGSGVRIPKRQCF